MATIAELFQAAVQYHQAGYVSQADQLYRQVVQADPGHFQAACNLGVLAAQSGQYNQAIAWYHDALRINPTFAEAHYNLGNTYSRCGQHEEAIACYRETVRLNPNFTAAHALIGRTLLQLGRAAEAVAAYTENLRLQPDSPEAHTSLATALWRSGRQDEGMHHFREALRLNPEYAEGYYALACALSTTGKLAEVEANLRQTVQLRPNFAEAHNNLGITLEALGRLDDAAAALQQALYWNPNMVAARTNLGLVRLAQGRFTDAARCQEEALQQRPDFMAAHSNLLLALNYDPKITPGALLDAHRSWEQRHARVTPLGPLPDLDRNPDRRLRIGYVSPNLMKHPVAAFLEPILAHHDRNRITSVCYAEVIVPDAVTEKLKGLAGEWRSTSGLTDEQVAELIRRDRIDILVDLAGHAGSSRLRVFAFRPAPVQVTYLGYPNTTGLSSIGYQLTDALIDPPGDEQYHSEELVRLPGCFCCWAPPADAPPLTPLPAEKNGFVTFGSLHNLAKLNNDVLDVWAAMLRAVPSARLFIFRHTLGGSTKDNLVRQFAQRGVAAERLDLRSKLDAGQEFLNLYANVDISLDTFPWCGHTTACESLWMGVPMLTMYGARRAGRMVASVLQCVGLPEWIAQTPEQFVARATEAAGNVPRLAELRRGMRDRLSASPLCNGAAFTRHLEEAYRAMWRRFVGR